MVPCTSNLLGNLQINISVDDPNLSRLPWLLLFIFETRLGISWIGSPDEVVMFLQGNWQEFRVVALPDIENNSHNFKYIKNCPEIDFFKDFALMVNVEK